VCLAKESSKRRITKEVLISAIPAVWAKAIRKMKIADDENLVAVRINRDGRLWIVRIASYILLRCPARIFAAKQETGHGRLFFRSLA
jgi:hypothetical protein